MAKTILTSKQIEKLSDQNRFAFFAPADAKLPWFPEHLFMGNGPRDAGDGQSQYEQPYDLLRKRHTDWKLLDAVGLPTNLARLHLNATKRSQNQTPSTFGTRT